MAWLKLIRWQNLLIILLTQLVVWYCLLLPQGPVVLNFAHFLLLSGSTVLIAAAGYIINDYFDIKIDQVNHPEKVVLGKSIVRKHAIIAHTIINVIALAMAGYVAAFAHHYEWLLVQLGCTGLLWFYSTTYKRQYISGNIIVSALTSLTVVILYVYEPAMTNFSATLAVWILGVYTFFAFMLTWIRELVKDMEDMEGDAAEGCVTMPIEKGLQYAARFATVLAVLVIIPMLISAAALYHHGYTAMTIYVVALLALPLTAWIWYLWQGIANPAHYHKCSRILKMIMVSGVCLLLIYKLQ
jgi:4-hydroxybenzoate polyprenyltransferase